MAIGLPEKNSDLILEAKNLAKSASQLLAQTLELARGVIRIRDDHVTNNTLDAENLTAFLSGMEINTEITLAENKFKDRPGSKSINQTLIGNVELLNEQAMNATKKAIRFNTKVLNEVLNCKVFSSNYPKMLEHTREEAVYYFDMLTKLQSRQEINVIEEEINLEAFWNHIMEEHSKFIRGLLDPKEEKLIEVADTFAKKFEKLTNQSYKSWKNFSLFSNVTKDSLALTKELKLFKKTATEGILKCNIRSIILPLLADHVTREANHFIIMLNKMN